ncbi:tpr-like protein [Apiospora arundinis]
MPSEPTFDYYAELELEPGSSIDEVRNAYRRLAMARHPDRNPNDATATAAFQRLNEACETLSDPNKKRQYDMCHVRPGAVSGSGSVFAEDNYGYGNPHPTQFGGTSSAGQFFAHNFRDDFFRHPQTTAAQAGSDVDIDEFFRDLVNRVRRQRQERDYYATGFRPSARPRTAAEIQQQQAIAEARQRAMEVREIIRRQQAAAAEARRADQQEAAERRAAAQEEAARMERAEQETRWTRFRATTAGDKRNACLHSQHDGWAKQVHQRKPKCESCLAKRSMTTFACPYCEIMVCPKCRDELVKNKREVAEKH